MTGTPREDCVGSTTPALKLGGSAPSSGPFRLAACVLGTGRNFVSTRTSSWRCSDWAPTSSRPSTAESTSILGTSSSYVTFSLNKHTLSLISFYFDFQHICRHRIFVSVSRTHAASRKGPLDGADPPSFSARVVILRNPPETCQSI